MPPDRAAVPWAPAYLRARSAEGRLYPDDVVARLPLVPPSDPLAREWRMRADSATRLVGYLRRGPRSPAAHWSTIGVLEAVRLPTHPW